MPQDRFLDINAWKILDEYIPDDVNSIQTSIVKHIEYTLAKNRFTFDQKDCYLSAAYSIRDRLIESFNDTQTQNTVKGTPFLWSNFLFLDVKRVYYLSLEFMIGRHMQNAL